MRLSYDDSFEKIKRKRDYTPPITDYVCGKRSFDSYKTAKRRLKQGWQRTMRDAAPYKCPECRGYWHIGNPNRF